jgi:Cu+-exporting ATPase
METVNWKVEGMSCSNCALTIGNYLKKEGLDNVKVNLITGDVNFDMNGSIQKPDIVKGIHALGYHVHAHKQDTPPRQSRFLQNHLQRFLFCLLFTAPLMLHMLDHWVHIHWLMNPWW